MLMLPTLKQTFYFYPGPLWMKVPTEEEEECLLFNNKLAETKAERRKQDRSRRTQQAWHGPGAGQGWK